MKLQTFVVGAMVACQIVTAAALLWLDRVVGAPLAIVSAATAALCIAAALVAHRFIGRALAAPLHELVVLAHQIAAHREVPRLRGRIREIALLEESLRRMTAELSTEDDAETVLSADVAHELRSSLSAVKNALYYLKEVARDQGLAEKDPALPEIIAHAELELEKAAGIATPTPRKAAARSKGGPRRATA